MIAKNIVGILIIISNFVGILLMCMNSVLSRCTPRKKQIKHPSSTPSNLPNEEEAIRDDLLKDIDLSDLDDLDLDDFNS